MPALLNRRRASHQFLCLALAALMPLTPITAVAQQQQPAESPPLIDGSEPASLKEALPKNNKSLLADPAGAAQHEPLNLAFAVPNSILFVAARPAQIFASPVAEFYPTEVIQAAGVKELGIDPLTTESVVFALAPTIGGPPSYSVITRFNKPIDLKAGKATEHAVAAEVAGRQYFQSNDPMLPSLGALDDNSLLVAPDYFFRSLVTAKEPAKVSPFAAAFAAADQGDDLLAMIDVSQVRALISMGLNQADVPPELASLKELPNLVKFIELRVNLSRPAPSSLIVTANDEADAEKLVAIVDEMKQLVAKQWAVESQRANRQRRPRRASRRPLLDAYVAADGRAPADPARGRPAHHLPLRLHRPRRQSHGRHRHHRRAGRPAAARGPGRPRSRSPQRVDEQYEEHRAGAA